MIDTLKTTDESELSFIGKAVKSSLEYYETTWDMTVLGAAMLGVASQGNPGMALYMLDVLDPQPDSLITDMDIVNKFPAGFVGDWNTTWDEFRVKHSEQRAVFER